MTWSNITSVEEISAAWLTALLSARRPSAQVTRFRVDKVIGGTATKVRLELEYDDQGRRLGLPPSLWLKAGFEAKSHTDHLRAVYLGEALFYRDLAAELDLGPPGAYGAFVDEASMQSYVLLEDLIPRHVAFGHATRPLTPEEAARVLELLAKLHARYWGGARLRSFDWLQGGGALIKSGVHDLTYGPEIWDRSAGLPRGRLMTGRMADRQEMHRIMQAVLAYDQAHAACLAHGDAQLMNLYFEPDGSPGLLDWQTVMFGHWAHDVTEFVVTALTIEDRRAAERDLVAGYVEALRRRGVPAPSHAEAWEEYGRHTAYTFHWALCQPEWQPEEVCLANAERACAAIADHDSLSRW